MNELRPVRRARLATIVASLAALALVLGACGSNGGGSASSPGTTAGSGIPGKARDGRVVSGIVLPDFASTAAMGDAMGTGSTMDMTTGRPFPIKAPPGKLLLVYFGYLTCPDICPLTMVDTKNGLDALGADADKVDVAFVTVDLDRDTGEKLDAYLQSFFEPGRYHGLRAQDKDQLQQAAYLFGANYKVAPHDPGNTTYGVAHSGETYVVNDQGQLIWQFQFGTDGDQLATALRELLAQQTTTTMAASA